MSATPKTVVLLKYSLVWLLLAVVAVVNGVVRQASYGQALPELVAHQLSTVTAIVATTILVWLIHRRWRIASASEASAIGLLWLILTIAFEFGFGHYIAGHSWAKLLADYNLLQGRIWSLFLIWIAVLPWLLFKFSAGSVKK